jgi:CAAX protease family protein
MKTRTSRARLSLNSAYPAPGAKRVSAKHPSMSIARRTYITFAMLILVWILVWTLKVDVLDSRFAWLTTSVGAFAFWTAVKVIVWILPALWLVRVSGRGVSDVVNLANWKSALAWGLGIGLVIASFDVVPRVILGRPLSALQPTLAALNAVVVAPVFEEFLLRGAVLGNLLRTHSLRTANIASALLFLSLHLPGWYYMGHLSEKLTTPLGGAVSIFLLGLAFGYATYRSQSVVGGVVAHFVNNLAA